MAQPFQPQTAAEFERHTLGVRTTFECDSARLTITANLVATNAATFKRAATDAIASGASTLVVDLAGTPYIDSQGLGALVSIANQAKRAEIALVVQHASEDLRTLFELTGIGKLFDTSTAGDR